MIKRILWVLTMGTVILWLILKTDSAYAQEIKSLNDLPVFPSITLLPGAHRDKGIVRKESYNERDLPDLPEPPTGINELSAGLSGSDDQALDDLEVEIGGVQAGIEAA